MSDIFYPRLSSIDFGYFRLGGPGLANCLFLASRAYINAVLSNGIMLNPTWEKFSIGPYLRKERDKRSYVRLFHTVGIGGFKKLLYLVLIKMGIKSCVSYGPYDLSPYYEDLNKHFDLVSKYFDQIIRPEVVLRVVPLQLSSIIAIHIRCGDYPKHLRVPMEWYVKVVANIRKQIPDQEFALFSDGTDEELQSILHIGGGKKALLRECVCRHICN